MESGIGRELSAVWGTSSRDVFAVGYGTILHYDGVTWEPMRQKVTVHSSLYGIWGSSGQDVFAVGYNGIILHHRGLRWKGANKGVPGTLHAVWGSSPEDVFAVGDGGTILHYSVK